MSHKVTSNNIPVHGCCCSVAKLCLTLCNSMNCSSWASLSFTISWSLCKLMFIESMIPSNHLILVVPSSSCFQSFPTSGSFPMSQLFSSDGQRTRASVSVLPINIQGWSPLEWTGWISLLSKGLSRVFSNTTVQKCQFFGAQPSSQSNPYSHTWPQEKP